MQLYVTVNENVIKLDDVCLIEQACKQLHCSFPWPGLLCIVCCSRNNKYIHNKQNNYNIYYAQIFVRAALLCEFLWSEQMKNYSVMHYWPSSWTRSANLLQKYK